MEKDLISNNKLHENLNYLAYLDTSAWHSFKEANAKKAPRMFLDFFAATRIIGTAKKEKRMKFYESYRIWLALIIIILLVTPLLIMFVSKIYIIVFVVVTFPLCGILFKTWSKYEIEHYRQFLKIENPLKYAFGTENITFLVKSFEDTFFKKIEKDKGQEFLERIKSKDFDALIKLNKAAQDKDEVNLGVGETAKKAAYGGIIVSVINLDFGTFEKATGKYLELFQKMHIVQMSIEQWLWFSLFLLAMGYLVYDLFLGQTKVKRRKKKYLLFLNMLKETWTDKLEMNNTDHNPPKKEYRPTPNAKTNALDELIKYAAYGLCLWRTMNKEK